MLSVKDDSGVIFINDWGSHALCVFMHWGDTPTPSRGYGRVHPMVGQRLLCFA